MKGLGSQPRRSLTPSLRLTAVHTRGVAVRRAGCVGGLATPHGGLPCVSPQLSESIGWFEFGVSGSICTLEISPRCRPLPCPPEPVAKQLPAPRQCALEEALSSLSLAIQSEVNIQTRTVL